MKNHPLQDHPLFGKAVMGQYKFEDLHEAFGQVQDKTNWKMPIKATVRGTNADVTKVLMAIGYFTGGPGVCKNLGKDKWLITGRGYYYHVGS